MIGRAGVARTRLEALRSCPRSADRRPHLLPLLNAWLQVATAAEVRRAWSRRWGKLPGWAVA